MFSIGKRKHLFAALVIAIGLPAVTMAGATQAGPTDVKVSPGDKQLLVSWQGPVDASYQTRSRPVGGSWNYDTVGKSTSHTLLGLTNGTKYEIQVRVKAKTREETSSYSPVVYGIPSASFSTATTTAPTSSTTTTTKAPSTTTTAPTSSTTTTTKAPSTTTTTAAVTSTTIAVSKRRHITPTGGGTRDGSSWSNAGAITDLNKFIGALSAGGEVWVRADAGSYDTGSVSISSGATSATAPVVVRGVTGSGTAMKATFVGSRLSPWKIGGANGGENFKFYSGSKNLVFKDFHFKNEGTAFNVVGNVNNLVISDVTAVNIRRFFENYKSSTELSANINGLKLQRIRVDGFSKSVARFQYNSANILMEDVIGDSQRQDGDNFAMGVHIDHTAHDIVLRRVTMANSHSSLGTYWNGDGFASERGNYNITFEDTNATGATDGGYDLKSSNTKMIRAKASDNKRNYRFWGQNMVVTDCVGGTHQNRGGSGSHQQIWAAPTAVVTMTGCSFTDRIIVVEDGGKVTIDGKLYL